MYHFLLLTSCLSFVLVSPAMDLKKHKKEKMAEDSSEVKKSYEEKVEDFKAKIPFDISGSMDIYAQVNFLGKRTNDVKYRVFDGRANSFELGMFNLMMSKTIKRVTFLGDIAFGPRANVANYSANALVSSTTFVLKQLYIAYEPVDGLKFTLGNFSTFFGYELIEANNNFHYSCSQAFLNGPFYHTGFKMNYTRKKFGFMVGFFNDTDTKSDADRNKYVGAQVSFADDNTGLYLNFLGGNQRDANTDTIFKLNYKTGLDLTFSRRIKGKGTVALNAAYYMYRQKLLADPTVINRPKYYTVYVYGNMDLGKKQRGSLGARVGYFNNTDAIALDGVSAHIADFTLTGAVKIGPLRLVPEFRLDYSTSKPFMKRNGDPSNIQTTLGIAAIVGF
ncbi:MAG: hypothetical protein JWN78_1725 [Bacteroidota bacterium]|nr:hypothetical protein [Bacteroidota bacterium]